MSPSVAFVAPPFCMMLVRCCAVLMLCEESGVLLECDECVCGLEGGHGSKHADAALHCSCCVHVAAASPDGVRGTDDCEQGLRKAPPLQEHAGVLWQRLTQLVAVRAR
jgi:hypothetical protein